MKKIFIILAILATSLFFATAETTPLNNPRNFPNDGGYHVLCYKCRSHAKREPGYYGCWGCYAWRRHDIPNVTIDGESHMVYKCQHGHTLYLSVNSKNRR